MIFSGFFVYFDTSTIYHLIIGILTFQIKNFKLNETFKILYHGISCHIFSKAYKKISIHLMIDIM